jgi:hypothetical protein
MATVKDLVREPVFGVMQKFADLILFSKKMLMDVGFLDAASRVARAKARPLGTGLYAILLVPTHIQTLTAGYRFYPWPAM